MTDRDKEILDWIVLAKGDTPGHEFHGNQYTAFGVGADMSGLNRLDTIPKGGVAYVPSEWRTDKWGSEPRGPMNFHGLKSASRTTGEILKAAAEVKAFDALPWESRRSMKPPVTPRYIAQRDIEQREFAMAKLRGMVKDAAPGERAPFRAALRANAKYLDALRLAVPDERWAQRRDADYSKIRAKGVYDAADKTMAALPAVHWGTLRTPNELSAYVSQFRGDEGKATAEHLEAKWGHPSWDEKGWGHANWSTRTHDMARAVNDFVAHHTPDSRLSTSDNANARKFAELKELGAALGEIAKAHSYHGRDMASHVSSFEGDEYEGDAFEGRWSDQGNRLVKETSDIVDRVARLLPTPPR